MDSWPHSNDYSQAVTQLTSTVPSRAVFRLKRSETRTLQENNVANTYASQEAFKTLGQNCTSSIVDRHHQPCVYRWNKPSDSLGSFVSEFVMDKPRKRSTQEKNPENIANISRSKPMHDLARPMQGTCASTMSLYYLAYGHPQLYTVHLAIATFKPVYSDLQPCKEGQVSPKKQIASNLPKKPAIASRHGQPGQPRACQLWQGCQIRW